MKLSNEGVYIPIRWWNTNAHSNTTSNNVNDAFEAFKAISWRISNKDQWLDEDTIRISQSSTHKVKYVNKLLSTSWTLTSCLIKINEINKI